MYLNSIEVYVDFNHNYNFVLFETEEKKIVFFKLSQ